MFCRCAVGCDSSVGIATRYKLDGPGIEYDDLQHRLNECGEGRLMWEWIRGRLARILRNTWRQTPDGWIMRPDFTLWPPKRRRAVLWLLANFVAFWLQQRDRMTRQDYCDFLRRAKWKLQEVTRWNERVSNYLSGFTEDPPTRDGAKLTPPQKGQRNVWMRAANR